jgi:hypothetical protein
MALAATIKKSAAMVVTKNKMKLHWLSHIQRTDTKVVSGKIN